MDREKLLCYFQSHYLSRQEVLYKLPFSIPIGPFWQELINRRKSNATVLSLYNSSGMPYWYVLTDRMVEASEKLCEAAMEQTEQFDPYRAIMTGAMIEEMFFTSFVEGAQIPLKEAMVFLQRGTEPENVQEQMIWNNRQAWSAMVGALYRPLDEPFVKSLAFILTDGMEGRAEDYRQSDNHTIIAMRGEPYYVPIASLIPQRMSACYDFLRQSDVHPLIKAAVVQAYLLVMRPFPEGNERLSRMLSYAVLLQSGYDFFSDISISGLIARENYRYYKTMCEILRPENGGDLTYFVEYYLDLLVQTLDAKKERCTHKEQSLNDVARSTLDQERNLPVVSLAVSNATTKIDDPFDFDSKAAVTVTDIDTSLTPESRSDVSKLEDDMISPPISMREFKLLLKQCEKRGSSRAKGVVAAIRKCLSKNIMSFTSKQWQKIRDTTDWEAKRDCVCMMANKLVISDHNNAGATYTLICSSLNSGKSQAPIKRITQHERIDAMISHLKREGMPDTMRIQCHSTKIQ